MIGEEGESREVDRQAESCGSPQPHPTLTLLQASQQLSSVFIRCGPSALCYNHHIHYHCSCGYRHHLQVLVSWGRWQKARKGHTKGKGKDSSYMGVGNNGGREELENNWSGEPRETNADSSRKKCKGSGRLSKADKTEPGRRTLRASVREEVENFVHI